MLGAMEHSHVHSIAECAMEALAQLDAEALEDLLLQCEALRSQEFAARSAFDAAAIAQWNLAMFARVIAASRANMNVLRQSSATAIPRLEYGGSGN